MTAIHSCRMKQQAQGPFSADQRSHNTMLVPLQISMNGMMETICTFEGKRLPLRHIPGPEGVRGRNSDNALILEKLGWEPTIKLADGLKLTYFWIKSQLAWVTHPSSLAFLLITIGPPWVSSPIPCQQVA